jgi:hypothetical protein
MPPGITAEFACYKTEKHRKKVPSRNAQKDGTFFCHIKFMLYIKPVLSLYGLFNADNCHSEHNNRK